VAARSAATQWYFQMKLRVYLDTSVISAYFDDRTPERMAETRAFWQRLSEFEVSTSALVRDEIEQTTDIKKLDQMMGLIGQTAQAELTAESRELARQYVQRGLFSRSMYSDALHLAVSVLTRQDILVSWNFKHLVNRRKRAQVAEANTTLDLPTIDILSPPEM
jgi:predicted nucleic acid-binding protein